MCWFLISGGVWGDGGILWMRLISGGVWGDVILWMCLISGGVCGDVDPFKPFMTNTRFGFGEGGTTMPRGVGGT
jgi:hypothetical protein